MKQNESKPQGTFSRRSFLKGSALLTLGMTGACGAFGMTGCSDDGSSGSSGKTQSSPSDELSASEGSDSPQVYDTELLIIGGGVAANQAALQAAKEGVRVTIVDKGPYQFSGVGGMNFDIMVRCDPRTEPAFDVGGGISLADKELLAKAWPFSSYTVPMDYVRQGVSTLRRNDDGTIYSRVSDPSKQPDGSTFSTDFGFMRHASDVVLDKPIDVYDETMITDLVVSDGVCRGAIGLHIPSGSIRIFRSKAVLKATGGCTQFNGWKSVNACTTQGGDNTADVDVTAYRHGCGLTSCEFFRWDTVQSAPDGIAFAFNSGFTADTQNAGDITDVDGTRFLEGVTDRTVFFQTAAKQIAAGKANENGAFYVDMKPETVAAMRPVYKRNVELWKDIFGIDVEGATIEVSLQCYEHGGSPRIDANMMSLTLPGLFDARGSSAYGETAGLTAVSSFRFPPYSASCASSYIKSLDEKATSFDWDSVKGECDRLEEIRTRTNDNPIDPYALRHVIQATCHDGIAPAGDAAQYENAISELEKILQDDLPRQTLRNTTKVFNTEWKVAIENYNLAIMGLATIKAMLMREETRAQFMRSDFPEPDDFGWGTKLIEVRLRNDTMELEAIDAG